MEPLEKIKKIFEKYTTAYHFYLKDLRTGQEYELGTKQRYPICSCFKLAVLMAYFDSIKSESELFEEVVIQPEQFSPGGGIVNYFTTPVKFTYFQLAQMMMAFSDGTATDLLIDRVGLDLVNKNLVESSPESYLNTNLGNMVLKFNSLSKKNGDPETRFSDAVNAIIPYGYTDAIGLSKLALKAFQYPNAIFQKILKTRKQSPRTNLYFGAESDFIGKTGSIGFGYCINDCGVILFKEEPVGILGYTSIGWPLARELVEPICGMIGLEAARFIGVNDKSPRIDEKSERFLA